MHGAGTLKDFSKLPPYLQERYYNFFVDNNVRFSENEDGDYVATMRVFDPAGQEVTPSAKPTTQRAHSQRDEHQRDLSGRSTTASAMRSENSRQPGPGHTKSVTKSSHGKRSHWQPAQFNTKLYPRFCSLIQQRGFLKAKQRPVTWLLKLIEEIYDVRYAHDLNEGKNEELGDPKENHLFPVFVSELFCKKYGLKSLVEQVCWDLVCNVQEYRGSYQEVDIFGCLLDEFYDPDDLLFFLYVRSVIQQQQSKAAKHSSSGSNGMGKKLTDRICMNVVRTVFGDDPDVLLDDFFGEIDEHLVCESGSRERMIDVHTFLALALQEYHNTRPQDEFNHDEPLQNRYDSDEMEENFEDGDNLQQQEWSHRISQLEAARHVAMREQQESSMHDEDKELQFKILETMKANGFKSHQDMPQFSEFNTKVLSPSQSSIHLSPPAAPTLLSPQEIFSFSVSPTSTEGPETPQDLPQTKNAESPIENEGTLQLIMELRECLVEDTHSYLDTIMSAAEGLPLTVQEEILAVVEGRLQAKVAAALSEILESCQDTSEYTEMPDEEATEELQNKVNEMVSEMVNSSLLACQGPISAMSDFEVPNPSPEADVLAEQYHELLISQLSSLTKQLATKSPNSRHLGLGTFSRTLLGSPDLRQEIEPLVVFLVIFATKQIENAAGVEKE